MFKRGKERRELNVKRRRKGIRNKLFGIKQSPNMPEAHIPDYVFERRTQQV